MANLHICYLCGPMTGMPDLNFPAFRRAAECLASQGIEVMDPSRNPKGWTRVEHMRADFVQIVTLSRVCGFVVALPGWRKSKGAKTEVLVALECGMKVYEASEPGPDMVLSKLVTDADLQEAG